MGTEEPTAIQQFSGGPCAVIAPVQAFLLKNLLPHYTIEQLKQVTNHNQKYITLCILTYAISQWSMYLCQSSTL